jgi:phosphatidylserine decarboxylase
MKPIYFIIACIILFIGLLIYFYRKPTITIYPNEEHTIRGPAFGKVMKIMPMENDTLFIAIFLNVNDIHYQTNPVNGYVKNITYDHTGRFELAYEETKSRMNEKMITTYQTSYGNLMMYQIAGFMVRRIKTYLTLNQYAIKGDMAGLIFMGSRVDLIIPQSSRFKLFIKENDRINGSDTIIGEYIH